jgi:hypothetical protein
VKARLLFLMALSILCLIPVGPSRADATPVISVDPPSVRVPQNQIGGTFQVGINVTNVNNLWQWAMSIQWNPQVLNLTGITEGSFLKSVGSTIYTSQITNSTAIKSGFLPQVACDLLSAYGANGSGVLADLTFVALAPGTSNITVNILALTTYSQAQISSQVANGDVVVLPEFQGWILPIISLTATAVLIVLRKKRLLRS